MKSKLKSEREYAKEAIMFNEKQLWTATQRLHLSQLIQVQTEMVCSFLVQNKSVKLHKIQFLEK